MIDIIKNYILHQDFDNIPSKIQVDILTSIFHLVKEEQKNKLIIDWYKQLYKGIYKLNIVENSMDNLSFIKLNLWMTYLYILNPNNKKISIVIGIQEKQAIQKDIVGIKKYLKDLKGDYSQGQRNTINFILKKLCKLTE